MPRAGIRRQRRGRHPGDCFPRHAGVRLHRPHPRRDLDRRHAAVSARGDLRRGGAPARGRRARDLRSTDPELSASAEMPPSSPTTKGESVNKFLTLLGIVSVLGLGLVGSAAGTVTTNTIIPISFTTFVPCANGGAGEYVALSG